MHARTGLYTMQAPFQDRRAVSYPPNSSNSLASKVKENCVVSENTITDDRYNVLAWQQRVPKG